MFSKRANDKARCERALSHPDVAAMDRLGAALRLCGVFFNLIAASFAAIVDGNHRMALLQHRLLIASGMAAFACVNRWMKTGAPRCMGNVSKCRQGSAAKGLFCANLRDGVIFESLG
ncbi:hypothetical protein QYQ99_17030 [Comamonas testosteroni]|uniref:hypothetical protein n=1 Tax=Comamonas testosteroni TaxID=285 RepID=UPI00265EBBF1|nr:hypothetical protein [Comamonas testosteroni]WKL14114.1 hypothetical protein QYQ99_17030 [Comamonas testosteroni]